MATIHHFLNPFTLDSGHRKDNLTGQDIQTLSIALQLAAIATSFFSFSAAVWLQGTDEKIGIPGVGIALVSGLIAFYFTTGCSKYLAGRTEIQKPSDSTDRKYPKLSEKIHSLRNPYAFWLWNIFGNRVGKNKAVIFELGIERMGPTPSNVKGHTLEKAEDFFLSIDKKPSYFDKPVSFTHDVSVTSTGDFYDYQISSAPTIEDIWVDFANANLGGGCFTHGFVQEEIMVAEMPDFAEHIAANPGIKVRSGTSRSFHGSPQPYLLKGLHRVQHIKGIYQNHALETLSEKELHERITAVDPLQEVTVLAIAAPKLRQRELTEQTDFKVAKDLFNTLVAGFKLAKEQSQGKTCLIHSGNFGCGDFKNLPLLVHVLHFYAAAYVGVDLKMYGVKKSDFDIAFSLWNALQAELTGMTIERGVEIIAKKVRESSELNVNPAT